MKSILLFHNPMFGNIVHPFLVDEAKLLSEISSKVYVLSVKPRCADGFDKTFDAFPNIIVKPYSKNGSVFNIPFSLYHFLTPEYKAEKRNVKQKKSNKYEYFHQSLRTIAVGDFIYKKIEKIIKKDPNEKWIIDSYWFDSAAYAAALLKKKYKNVYSFTRAHSFEIDPIKNEFYYAGMKFFSQKYLDGIFFISDYGKNFYLSDILSLYNKKEWNDNCKVFRLGTEKKADIITSSSNDSVFRIVSCSRIAPEKRVDLIAKALLKIDNIRIEWTHIGGGNYQPILDLLKEKQNIICHFTGYKTNDFVHNFYINNCVDLFVNVSSSEGIPVSVMEAMSYGIPVLATDVGGTKELVTTGCGKLLNSNVNDEEVAQSIIEFIEKDRNLYLEMKNNCKQKWEADFSKRRNNQMIIESIKKAVEYGKNNN